MPGYLLDTQTITYWFDGQSGQFPVVQAAAEKRAANAPLYVSAITLGEIEYGHSLNPDGVGEKRTEFIRFIQTNLPQILQVSKHTAEPYGLIRSHLVQKFPPSGGWGKRKRAEQLYDPVAAREIGIDENNLWLVAQAVERNLIFVTNDKKMQRIRDAVIEVSPTFTFENWASDTSDAAT